MASTIQMISYVTLSMRMVLLHVMADGTELNILSVFPAPEQFVVTTDASSLGGGGVLQESRETTNITAQGRWSLQ